MKKLISILLIIGLLLSAAASFAFAEGEEQPQLAITGFNTYSAYQSVVLEWDKPSIPFDRYEIYSDGDLIDTVTAPKSPFDAPDKLMYKDEEAADEKTHKYFIKAYRGETDVVQSEVKKDQAVKQMYIKMTFRTTRLLRSHDGKKKKRTFKKGYTTKAVGYAGGRYHFYDKGNLFFVNYMSVGNFKALYTKDFNYSKREAEYFVNTSGAKSKKKYLIWVNLYTQHLYVFQGSAGKWKINSKLKHNGKVYKDWEISSGTPATPSPWGMKLKYGGKETNLYKKMRYFPGHGAELWNFYHSESALHGPAGRTGYGAPHSHGCIRNPQKNAEFLLEKIPTKTRIIIY